MLSEWPKSYHCVPKQMRKVQPAVAYARSDPEEAFICILCDTFSNKTYNE